MWLLRHLFGIGWIESQRADMDAYLAVRVDSFNAYLDSIGIAPYDKEDET